MIQIWGGGELSRYAFGVLFLFLFIVLLLFIVFVSYMTVMPPLVLSSICLRGTVSTAATATTTAGPRLSYPRRVVHVG